MATFNDSAQDSEVHPVEFMLGQASIANVAKAHSTEFDGG
jgi:hypothetical protein